ncbi:MAG: nitroreductase/quinone reductase family protein, partial [Gammaproteobacteria bacterium]
NYLIVGSKGGADTDPGWYFNLLASPAVELQVGKEKFVATARLAEGAEHERLWSIMTKVFPPYITYQNKTSRRIPIFVLEAE